MPGRTLWMLDYNLTPSTPPISVAGDNEETGLALAGVEKVDLLELGVWCYSIVGTSVGCALYTQGDALYGAAGTLQKQMSTLATATKKIVVQRVTDVTITPDYSGASTDFTSVNQIDSGGLMKLSMQPHGTHTEFIGKLWCWLRIWKRADL
jgi:hypothetical protein